MKNLTSCAVTVVSHCAILKTAVNVKAWNSGNRFMKKKILAEIFNIKHFTLFIWVVLACCVVVFPIPCDFRESSGNLGVDLEE